ncbi:MAG: glycosyltransferase [Alphaproteobacteria bacterium]
MNIIKKSIKKIIRYVGYDIVRYPHIPHIIVRRPHVHSSLIVIRLNAIGKKRGDVLLSYLNYSFQKSIKNSNIKGHSVFWDSYQIAKIFQKMGFAVDIINHINHQFKVKKKYDIFFDYGINQNIFLPKYQMRSKNILLLGRAFEEYQHSAELSRIQEFEKRKHCYYQPKRLEPAGLIARKRLQMANILLLHGNDWTLSTYPKEYQKKITLVKPSISFIKPKKLSYNYPLQKDFLFMFNRGAVHKGLDLVLDFFIKNKQYKLNILGHIDEPDFLYPYQHQLRHAKHIIFHGFLRPDKKKFISIINKCFCFISPSCSEGCSTATATAMAAGLFPIISKQNGIDLPKNAGLYLPNLSEDAIANAVHKVYNMDKKTLLSQTMACQELALKEYSREAFDKNMTRVIQQATKHI